MKNQNFHLQKIRLSGVLKKIKNDLLNVFYNKGQRNSSTQTHCQSKAHKKGIKVLFKNYYAS